MLACSFCGKNQKQVAKLISGMVENVHICESCVDLSNKLLEKENIQKTQNQKKKLLQENLKSLNPMDIHKELNEHVIGQEVAKKYISVCIYNHYKRIQQNTVIPIQKSNLIMVGPTGVGKTLIAKTVADYLDVPFIITDATTLTESGYAGDDVEVLLQRLLKACDYEVERAEMGIIYVDEIDKKAKRNDYVNLSRDVSGEGVQQSLLKLMEGTKVEVSYRHAGKDKVVDVDTSNILFIVSGAFVGLDEIVMQRIGKSKIGFSENISTNVSVWQDKLEVQDFIKYGLIPEFIGRLSSIAVLNDLSEEDLVEVLTQPKYSLTKQFEELFKIDNIKIEFEEAALVALAEQAIKQKLGARGLKKMLEDVLLNTQYRLPDLTKQGVTKIIITKDTVVNRSEPWLVKSNETVH